MEKKKQIEGGCHCRGWFFSKTK